MNIRYVLTKIDKSGLRSMVSSIQGRNTYATKEEAQTILQQFLTVNSTELLEDVYGKQAIGTFQVDAIECWPGHNDPKGPYPVEM